MSLELWNTVATFGTFTVIAATAIAALIQLRHARSSNAIAAVKGLKETADSEKFQAAQNFVLTTLHKKLQDPAYRRQIAVRAERVIDDNQSLIKVFTVGNHYEMMGLLVRRRLAERDFVLEMWYMSIIRAWKSLLPVTALLRRDGAAVWENFEYLALLATRWAESHPGGEYPPGTPRMPISDEWLAADTEYDSSLVGTAQHGFSHAAQEEAAQTGAAVASHHDKITAIFLRDL